MRRSLRKFKPSHIPNLALHLAADKGITSTESAYPVNTPMDIATPALWLDAALGVTLVGDHVSAWADQSGNLRHASQGTDDYRPHLVASGLNGKPVLRFDGTNDRLFNSSITGMSSLTGYTLFAVGKVTDQSETSIWVRIFGTYYAILFDVSANTVEFGASDQTVGASGAKAITGTSNVYELYSSVYDGSQADNATRLKGYQNGVQLSPLTFAGTVPSVLENNVSNLVVGAWATGTFMSGDIAEIIIYPSALSDADRKRVELYLGYKYGIATQCGQVSSWADQTTNARHASQTTAGYRPAYVTNALNGKPVLRFDGTNDYLTNVSFLLTGNAYTIFTVAKTSAAAGRIISAYGAEGTDWNAVSSFAFYFRNNPSLPAGVSLIRAGVAIENVGINLSTYYIINVVINSTSSSIAVNGASLPGTISASNLNTTTLKLGQSSSGSDNLAGDIAEIIIFSSALTTAQINAVNLSLAKKWGISCALIA